MKTRDLVFEIGVEEIPSDPLYAATSQMKELAAKALRDARLAYAGLATYGAPRRLVLVVTALAERQEDLKMRAKGPAVKGAFNADGTPTKAAEGFARGKGVAVADLVSGEENGGEYVYAVIEREGAPALDVLPELLASLASGLDWPKSQRWGSGSARFIRPVRSLLALFGSDVVPVEFAGLTAGRLVWGHRFLSENPIEVPCAGDYFEALERGCVVLDADERARFIREGVEAVAEREGGRAVTPEKTFAEVVNLVEFPTVTTGRFDEAFLRVPREILETAMESHQRYFPIEAPDGSLSSAFIVVHNGDPDRTEAIARGHERVIRARLADAAFFYDEDLGTDMEAWVERLATITFHEKLGTLAAKVERVEHLASAMSAMHGAGPDDDAFALRAAHLCKADLVSHVVVEFPSLQGVMGRYYALAAGEEPAVAEAIVEHYKPRFASDSVPPSLPGMVVSAADKLDTICGIFAIGASPTGSADPYALRRSAIGVLAMVLDGGLHLTLTDAIAAALEPYRDALRIDVDAVGSAVQEFFAGRLETMLRDRGNAFDTVEAVLAVSCDDPADVLARCQALTEARASVGMDDLAIAFARAKNLSEPELGSAYDRALMGEAEIALADAVEGEEGPLAEAVALGQHAAALGLLADLRPVIDTFFDAVLVMDPDLKMRANRLRLLNRFVALFDGVADFSKLQG